MVINNIGTKPAAGRPTKHWLASVFMTEWPALPGGTENTKERNVSLIKNRFQNISALKKDDEDLKGLKFLRLKMNLCFSCGRT